jgi:hypothetical protein
VPLVTGARIARERPFVGGVEITLAWFDPEVYRGAINKYNIYVTYSETDTPTVLVSPSKSPVSMIIPVAVTQKITLKIQTVLKNGQVSDLLNSPTVSTTLSALENLVTVVDVNVIVADAIAAADIPGLVDDAIAAYDFSAIIDPAVDAAITAEDIPGQIATAITAADIPGQVDDAITALDIPGMIDDAITAEDIPGQIAAGITAADIPGQVDDAITAADIPGQVAAAVAALAVNYIPAVPTTDVISFASTSDSATLLSTSVDGKLIGFGWRVLTTMTFAGGASSASVAIVNGATTSTIPMYTSSALNAAFQASLTANNTAGGITAGDVFFMPLDGEFTGTTSVTVTSAAAAANAGSLQVSLFYATKL